MAKIKDVLALLRAFAPERDTEPDFDDNVGLIVGSENGETERVLLCLDCTADAVEEAERIGAALIVSHHPAIFRPIRRVVADDPTGRMILAAARAGIAVYSAHTNLDFCAGGLNDYAAELMELTDVRPMTVVGGIPVGRVGGKKSGTLRAFSEKLATAFDDRHIRTIGRADARTETVAVINGGGGNVDYVRLAKERGADCYVTADVPHHVALYAAQTGMNMIIMQHYSMEAVYKKRLAEILTARAKERGLRVAFAVSESERNPAQQEEL